MIYRRIIFVVLGGLALATLGILGYMTWSDYRLEIRSAQTRTRDYAALLETGLDATLRRINSNLMILVASLPPAALSMQAVPAHAGAINAQLDIDMIDFPELAGLRIFDKAGDQLYSSNRANTPLGNVIDRDYFVRLRDQAQDGVVFSAVNISRTTGRPTMVVARGLRDERGDFLGIVIASVELEYLQKLFQSFGLGPESTVAVYRADDFSLVVSWPGGDNLSNTPLQRNNPSRLLLEAGTKVATLEYASAVDGVARIYAIRALNRYPFFVSVGIARDAALAGWKTRALWAGSSGLLLVGLLIALLQRLWHFEAKHSEGTDAIAQAEERWRLMFNRATDGIVMLSDSGKLLAVNAAFAQMHGYTQAEMTSMDLRDLETPKGLQSLPALLERVLAGESLKFEVSHYHKKGHLIALEVSSSVIVANGERLIQAFHRDITGRKKTEEIVHQLAYYDPLTKLANRELLNDRLLQSMKTGQRSGRYSALMFMDLDNFKSLNDQHGHGIGDLLLAEVAKRITSCVRQVDTVARFGGDEFIVLLDDLTGDKAQAHSQVDQVAEKLRSLLANPYVIVIAASEDGAPPQNVQHHGSASIGVTLFLGQESTQEHILLEADLAMYRAKELGGNTVCFFDVQMQLVNTERTILRQALRDSIVAKQFSVYYQAQLHGKGQITGVEALLRWQHPTRGMVSPAEFIPMAEETGLILPIGNWVLETACTQLSLWSRRPETAHLTMAINVSARQFHHSDFVDEVLAVLERTGANAKQVFLELTESVLITDVEDVIVKMNLLKAAGISFSLDDFGTGYSSLSSLKRLPLAQLKIAQEFVRDILIDPNDMAIARMVVALADSMDLLVIAEGVETEEQRDFLEGLGCHDYQGYLFSQALPVTEFEALVARVQTSAQVRDHAI